MAEFDELSGGQREKPDTFQTQFAFFVEVFRETFNLLEEYAPLWYTAEHHNRAVAALTVLRESRQLSRTTRMKLE
jgi:DNA-binding XRE family transcriptional regulator